MQRLLDHLKDLDRQVGEMEVQIQAWHRTNTLSRKLEKIPGIGPIMSCRLKGACAADSWIASAQGGVLHKTEPGRFAF